MDLNDFYQHHSWNLSNRPMEKQYQWKYCPACGYERPYFMFDDGCTICKYHLTEDLEKDFWMYEEEFKKRINQIT